MNNHSLLLNEKKNAQLIETVQYYHLYLQRKGEMDILVPIYLPGILTSNI